MADAPAGQTTIGATIRVNGNLRGDEDLVVVGRVDGSINLTKTLIVEESGIIKAEISVEHAVVNGVVVGNITASDSVQITDTGRIVGDIHAPRIIIVDGARFRGAVDMGELEAPRPSAPLPARSVERSALTRATRPSASPVGRPPLPPPTRREESSSAPTVRQPETAGMSTARATAPASKTPAKEEPVAKQAPVPAKKVIKKKVVMKKKG